MFLVVVCRRCYGLFRDKTLLVRHQKKLNHHDLYHLNSSTVTPDEVVIYRCDYKECNASYSSLGALNKHKRTHWKPFKCSHVLCGKRFATKWDLKVHRRIHLKTDNTPNLRKKQFGNETVRRCFVCRICHKAFDRKETLQRHWKVHADTDKEDRKRFECRECGVKFRYKSNVTKHCKKYHEIKDQQEMEQQSAGKKAFAVSSWKSIPSDLVAHHWCFKLSLLIIELSSSSRLQRLPRK